MKIIGKELAVKIYEEMSKKIQRLKMEKITPQLIIVKSKDIAAVNNYIRQKIRKGEKVGVSVKVVEFKDADFKNIHMVKKCIMDMNKLSTVHGIIFQKPGDMRINDEIENCVDPDKDVDGFLDNSPHRPPVYRGVMKVLSTVFKMSHRELIAHLKKKNIVLIGKGKTGGGTVISGFKRDGFDVSTLKIIDSKTKEEDKARQIKNANIIISAVGKPNPVDFHDFSKDAIIIDIGVHFDENNKIKGDFDEEDIKNRVAYYTTTPGGIGALTVAYLMDNTVSKALGYITS